MNAGLARLTVAVSVFATAIPGASLRAAVVGMCLILVIFAELKPGSQVSRLRFSIPALLFVAIAILSVFWSVAPAESALEVAQVGVAFLLASYLGWRIGLGDLHRGVGLGLKWLLAVSLAIELFVRGGIAFPMPTFGFGVTGVTANPNLMAFAAVLSAVTIGTLPRESFWRPGVRYGWLAACLLLVWQSRSGGGAIYLLVAAAVFVALQLMRRAGKASPMVVLVLLLPVPLVLVERVQQWLLSAAGVTQNVTLSGRTRIWEASLDGIAQAPWTGYGIGALRDYEVAPTSAISAAWRSMGLGTFNAHNGYLDVALQGGLVGLAAAVAVMLVTFWRFFQFKFDSPATLWGTVLMATYLVYNLTEARIASPLNAWFLLVLLATAAVNLTQRRAQAPLRHAVTLLGPR